MYWLHQIKNNIKGVKSFTKSWQSVFTSLHYFPERRPSYTFNFLCAYRSMLVTLILKTLVNTGVSTKTNKKICAPVNVKPTTSLAGVEGRLWVEFHWPVGKKNTKLCLNTPKLKGGTLQLNILHTWCHHTPWIQMEGEKRRGWIITLLYLLCWGSWAVVACLALMRVKVVSGPTAHSGATVEYRVVGCWAVVLWTGHDDLPGLL